MVMEMIHIGIDRVPSFDRPLSLAIGYFDGIHLGHQALINRAIQLAKQKDCYSAVISFEPNPSFVIGMMKEEKYVTSLQDRQVILEAMGVDYFLILDFDKTTMSLAKDIFVKQFIEGLNVKELVCGFDFTFGFKGQGNGTYLQSFDTFNTHIIDAIEDDNKKISTTRIVELLGQGNVEKANTYLANPFAISGKVVGGKQRGRLMGFPTANVDYGHYYLPTFGVYACKVIIKGKEYCGMCNIGVNPTFTDIKVPTCEVNIYDFNEDIYGEVIQVIFYKMTRPDIRFSSMEALIEQLTQDREEIKAYFSNRKS